MMSDNGDNRTQADYDYELLEQAYKELKAQNAELRGVVDKLPKTADGVPVVPRMNVYANRINGDGTWPDPYAGRLPQQFAVFDGVDWSRLPSECYSTIEAAESARKETP